MDTSTPQKQAALEWASKGYAVFPCVEDGKQPLIPGGVHAASMDAATVERWWTRWPRANIGCSPDASGCFVLDLDVKGDADGRHTLAEIEKEQSPIPDTFAVDTPSGGRHVWLRGRAPSTASKLGRGIDTRGSGTGYVLLPGSTVRGAPYTIARDVPIAVAPAWIAKLAGKRREPRRALHAAAPDELIFSALDWLRVREPAIADAGGNTRTWMTAVQMRDYGISQEAAPDVMAAWNATCVPPWEPEELEGIIANAYAYGRNEPGSAAPPDPAKVFPTPRGPFTPLTRGDMAGISEPPWLVPGWLPAHGVALLYGGKNSYKTFTLGAMALDLARQGEPVVQFIGEGGAHGIKKRIWAWERRHGQEMPAGYYPVPRVPTLTEANLPAAIEAIKALGIKPAMITVDTLTRMLSGLDLSFEHVSRAYGALETLAREFGCLVVGIGHSGKDAARGLAGSFAATANADVVIEASGEHLRATWSCAGMRDAEMPPAMHWEGEAVETDAGSSLVFRALSDTEVVFNQGVEPTPETVRAALQALGGPVSVKVLAMELLAGAEHGDEALAATMRRLTHLAKGPLAAYADRDKWQVC